MSEDSGKQPIIIKKVKKGGHGHHGGAWKVAYADFVTAMMAFFLLLWLLNVTTDEMKAKLSAYFTDPTHPNVSSQVGGAGGVMGGKTMSPEGARAHDQTPLTPLSATASYPKPRQGDNTGSKAADPKKMKDAALKKEFDRRQKQKFAKKKAELEAAIKKAKELEKLKDNINIEITPEGLKINITDKEGEAMFPSGSARMFSKTENVLAVIAGIITEMPNDLSVRGHTDAAPYTSRKDYSNWELSADRANATRRVLQNSGYPKDKVANVIGKGSQEPFIKDNAFDPRNRRISIVLLNEEYDPSAVIDDAADEGNESVKDGAYNEDGTLFSPDDLPDPGYKPSQGDVYFP